MNLAAIPVVCLIFLAWMSTAHGTAGRVLSFFSQFAAVQSADPGSATPGSQENASPPKSQPPASQPQSTSSTVSGAAKKASSPKSSSDKTRRRKKTPSDDSNAPQPQNQPNGASLDVPCSTGVGSTPPSNQTGPEQAASTNESAASNPCPASKKVVPNGGLKEPNVQLKRGTDAEQASHQRSADQLKTEIEENLKKIEGRHLNASQQEMVTQVKRFMEQSRTAIAAGDAERGHSLAMKARLLSDELAKP